ncbi:acetyl-CoA carboxylase biotin carboxylase subunit family protein [Streptomyces sp. NPDC058279]|uniref:ATP-grasp domain-containing protein n=1 Tax=Streptomyces sp. NPDC058279 TaxID=3346418 RepID=UPI0036E2CA86
MTALVLHRFPLEPFPYDRWLAELDGGVVLIAARDKILGGREQVPDGPGGYRHLEIIDTFDDEDLVDRLAVDLVQEYGITHVIAHHEADLIRAAALREKFGLPGQLPDEVLPFRDKVLMKRKLAAAGIAVAPHTLPGTAREARAFASAHGLPLVFKARDGFGSVGLRIVRTAEELEGYLAESFTPGAAPREDLLLEAYVPGRMCHVDGVVAGGRTVMAWPSQYQYELSSFQADSGARVDLTLDPSDPLTPRLLELAEEALAALGGPADFAFHAEVFHTPDDRLVVCEVAARPAGARIREVLTAVFGVHPVELASRAHTGLRLAGLGERRPDGAFGRLEPVRMAGQVLMMKRPGTVRGIPATPEEPWVEFYGVFAEPGEVLAEAALSSDFLAAAVLSAATREECEKRLRALGARFESEIVID